VQHVTNISKETCVTLAEFRKDFKILLNSTRRGKMVLNYIIFRKYHNNTKRMASVPPDLKKIIVTSF
jgi:hypothetical protein